MKEVLPDHEHSEKAVPPLSQYIFYLGVCVRLNHHPVQIICHQL